MIDALHALSLTHGGGSGFLPHSRHNVASISHSATPHHHPTIARKHMAPSRSSSHLGMSSSFYGSTLLPVSSGNTIDHVVRTKILLLGMRRCVPFPSPSIFSRAGCVLTERVCVQERQDVDPGGAVQQPPAETDVLPRDDAPCDQAYVRVRRLPPSPVRRALNGAPAPAQSFRWRYGTAPARSPLILSRRPSARSRRPSS